MANSGHNATGMGGGGGGGKRGSLRWNRSVFKAACRPRGSARSRDEARLAGGKHVHNNGTRQRLPPLHFHLHRQRLIALLPRKCPGATELAGFTLLPTDAVLIAMTLVAAHAPPPLPPPWLSSSWPLLSVCTTRLARRPPNCAELLQPHHRLRLHVIQEPCVPRLRFPGQSPPSSHWM